MHGRIYSSNFHFNFVTSLCHHFLFYGKSYIFMIFILRISSSLCELDLRSYDVLMVNITTFLNCIEKRFAMFIWYAFETTQCSIHFIIFYWFTLFLFTNCLQLGTIKSLYVLRGTLETPPPANHLSTKVRMVNRSNRPQSFPLLLSLSLCLLWLLLLSTVFEYIPNRTRNNK